MKSILSLLTAVLVASVVVSPAFGQQAPKGTEGPDVRKQEPKGTEGPDIRKGPSKRAGSRASSDTAPPPRGTEGPEARKGEQKKAQ